MVIRKHNFVKKERGGYLQRRNRHRQEDAAAAHAASAAHGSAEGIKSQSAIFLVPKLPNVHSYSSHSFVLQNSFLHSQLDKEHLEPKSCCSGKSSLAYVVCAVPFEIISGNAMGMGVYVPPASPTLSMSHRRRPPTLSRREVRHLSARRLIKASLRCLIAHMHTMALKRCAPTPHILRCLV